jgi:hypothetical protein
MNLKEEFDKLKILKRKLELKKYVIGLKISNIDESMQRLIIKIYPTANCFCCRWLQYVIPWCDLHCTVGGEGMIMDEKVGWIKDESGKIIIFNICYKFDPKDWYKKILNGE